ncbi:putative protein phosphatase 2C 5 [Acorus calamus]|uniref:Protein-serine/threonine phosphatase n=1 Tax=Acorus calamus TaxID=4465 RepID=A0AAV9DAJ6_ACOCL|nr:putative protein phosphatase 2C 5 [Acorus calamus]
MRDERMERPRVDYGLCEKVEEGRGLPPHQDRLSEGPRKPLHLLLVFAIFDGHNGSAAAIFTKESVGSRDRFDPSSLGREQWLRALPRALVAGSSRRIWSFREVV